MLIIFSMSARWETSRPGVEIGKEEADTEQETNEGFRGGKMEKGWIMQYQTIFVLSLELKSRGKVCGIFCIFQNTMFNFLRDMWHADVFWVKWSPGFVYSKF